MTTNSRLSRMTSLTLILDWVSVCWSYSRWHQTGIHTDSPGRYGNETGKSGLPEIIHSSMLCVVHACVCFCVSSPAAIAGGFVYFFFWEKRDKSSAGSEIMLLVLTQLFSSTEEKWQLCSGSLSESLKQNRHLQTLRPCPHFPHLEEIIFVHTTFDLENMSRREHKNDYKH